MASSHAYAPWRRALLVPFWFIQLLLEVIMIILLALSAGSLANPENKNDVVEPDGLGDTNLNNNAINIAQRVYGFFFPLSLVTY